MPSRYLPVAAIKITRHNLWRPTSLVPRNGHQVAHLTGCTEELGSALYSRPRAGFRRHRLELAELGQRGVRDVYAFVLLGYAPLPALATVVDGPSRRSSGCRFATRIRLAWSGVLFNAVLLPFLVRPRPVGRPGPGLDQPPPHSICLPPRSRKSAGRAWPYPCRPWRTSAHALRCGPSAASLCTALAHPLSVAPAELARLAERARASLYTSSYLTRLEAMHVLTLSVLERRRQGDRRLTPSNFGSDA